MSEVKSLIAEIKSKGLLRAGDKLELLYVVAAQLQDDYAALKAERDALAALAEERSQFIVNGVEMGDILLPVIDGDPAIGIHERCLLKPKFAYDAYLNALRAEGVDFVAEAIGSKCAELKIGSKDWKALKSIVFMLGDFSSKLRAGKGGE
jgi:hypothetical protein